MSKNWKNFGQNFRMSKKRPMGLPRTWERYGKMVFRSIFDEITSLKIRKILF